MISMSVLFCLLYAVSDEVHQMFVPNRDASKFDFIADAFGIAVVHVYCFFRRS